MLAARINVDRLGHFLHLKVRCDGVESEFFSPSAFIVDVEVDAVRVFVLVVLGCARPDGRFLYNCQIG